MSHHASLKALMLSALLAFSSFAAACGETASDAGAGKPADTAAAQPGGDAAENAETEPEKAVDGLPDTDLKGWEMRVIAHHDGLSDERTIYAAEMNGEIINDIIYER
ncbi:MAG: hypothetical protein IJT56_10485, partial [Clostridia bacterium]|nr:hypothetical protein [Clostridia bacterium]